MKITEKTWAEYITRLARLNETAGQAMAEYIARHGTADTAALIEYAFALAQKYGEGSAELACQMYDAIAEASGADVPAAEPADPASYDETANMVYATQNSPPLLQSGVSRLVKQAGADTTLKNAIRDGAEWAWVPHGDTCPFCITLASNGWQPASEKALKGGHAQHIHAHCDCEYAIRFDSRTTVAGYDPDKYLEQYYAYGGDINAMRRAQYASNKGKINAQKRAAYAARKLRASGNSGIIKLDNDRYKIDEPKLSRYLLKPGAKHYEGFSNVGYTELDIDQLNADIYRQFDESQKTDVRVSADGTETFSIFMELGTDKKRTFRTVWQREPGDGKPRLITAHREDKK